MLLEPRQFSRADSKAAAYFRLRSSMSFAIEQLFLLSLADQ